MKGARMLIRVANNISKFPSRKYCLSRALCTQTSHVLRRALPSQVCPQFPVLLAHSAP